MLNRERAEFGAGYHDYGLFYWEDGRPPHPDTITRRFHKLAEAAGLPKINLLSRSGTRFRRCHWPVSPDRSPNPPWPITEQRALRGCCRQAWFASGQGLGILFPR